MLALAEFLYERKDLYRVQIRIACVLNTEDIGLFRTEFKASDEEELHIPHVCCILLHNHAQAGLLSDGNLSSLQAA